MKQATDGLSKTLMIGERWYQMRAWMAGAYWTGSSTHPAAVLAAAALVRQTARSRQPLSSPAKTFQNVGPSITARLKPATKLFEYLPSRRWRSADLT